MSVLDGEASSRVYFDFESVSASFLKSMEALTVILITKGYDYLDLCVSSDLKNSLRLFAVFYLELVLIMDTINPWSDRS